MNVVVEQGKIRKSHWGGWRKLLVDSERSLRCGVLLALLLLAGCGSGAGEANPSGGVQLPPVLLTGLTSGDATSTYALRGAPLIVNFWASWCLPCREEMPSLEGLSQRLGGRGARVIGISVDNDLNLAAEFLHTHKVSFPNYTDGDRKALQSQLRIRALPETLLVTAEGVIVARIAGAHDWNSAGAVALLENVLGLRIGDLN